MIELSQNNLLSYLEDKIKELPFQVDGIKEFNEVLEHTYVNWNFKVVLDTAEGERIIYIRQARNHLKTIPEWEIKLDRLAFEIKILNLIDQIEAGVVPKVLLFDKENNVCFLSDIKKSGQILLDELREGNLHEEGGEEFGRTIGKIHGMTFSISNEEVRGDEQSNNEAIKFNFDIRFDQGKKAFPKEAEDIFIESKKAKTALVLGDLASKNIIVDGNKTRFLDLELAFIGDPAFDIGFLFCHYLLQVPTPSINKSLLFIENFMNGYRQEIGKYIDKNEVEKLENRVIRILGIILLYRIDDTHFSTQTDEYSVKWRDFANLLIKERESTNLPDMIKKIL